MNQKRKKKTRDKEQTTDLFEEILEPGERGSQIGLKFPAEQTEVVYLLAAMGRFLQPFARVQSFQYLHKHNNKAVFLSWMELGKVVHLLVNESMHQRTHIDSSAPDPGLFSQTEYLPHRHAWKEESDEKL